jgi:hypothetical protein
MKTCFLCGRILIGTPKVAHYFLCFFLQVTAFTIKTFSKHFKDPEAFSWLARYEISDEGLRELIRKSYEADK